MNTRINTLVAAAIALAAAAPAFANSQLVASAALTQEEAAGMTLSEIAATKNNRHLSFSDRQAVRIAPVSGDADSSQAAASVGLHSGASLNEIAAAGYNRDNSFSDRQIVRRSDVTVASRSDAAGRSGWAQFVASAGLSAEDAEGMSIDQIAAAKFNRDVSHSDVQRVGTAR